MLMKANKTGTIWRVTFIGALLSLVAADGIAEPAHPGLDSDLVIWDDAPAEQWHQAYPVGNGRLGAMPFADFPHEKVLINEETIWQHKGEMLMPENSFEHLERVRNLEASGDYQGADRYFQTNLQNNSDPSNYELAGWLSLEYRGVAEAAQTKRQLDLKTGIISIQHRLTDGSTIIEQVFAEGNDNVIAIVISSDKPLELRVSLDEAITENGDLVKAAAANGEKGTRFVTRLRVASKKRQGRGRFFGSLRRQDNRALSLGCH